jgi:hypothetical protein
MRTPCPRFALLTGALLACASSCGRPSTPLAIHDPTVAAAPDAVIRGRADDTPLDEPNDGFPFPDDKGGQVLARVLPPADKPPGAGADMVAGPRRLPGSPVLEQPSVPLPPNQGQVPRLSVGRQGPPLRPRSLPDELPLSPSRQELPQEMQFPAGDRVRLPGPEVSQPVPLPVLAVPAPDRGSSDDPTAEFSSAAAQTAAPPARARPAPFVRVSLPEPFENRIAVRLREPPHEKEDPVTAPPKPPGK